MALPIAPTIIKCSLFQTLNGQPIMNRFHIKVGATNPSQAECAAVASAVAGWWTGNVQTLVGDALQLREVHAMSLAEVNGPQATFSSGLPASGTITSPTLPGNVAFCVSFRTGLTGRSARGRWYWAGLTENQVAQNAVDGGTAASIVGAMDNLISTITGIAASPVIVSYYTNGALRYLVLCQTCPVPSPACGTAS